MFEDSGTFQGLCWLSTRNSDVKAVKVHLYSVITPPFSLFLNFILHAQHSNSLDLSKYLVN